MPEPLGTGEPLRLLVIGAGKMGTAHVEAFARVPELDVVAVASRSGSSAEKLARAHGVRGFGKNWRELAERYRPHACVVAVSHGENERITREVISAGLHVLAEKPVAFSSAAVAELAELAEARGVVAVAAMNRRCYESVLAALETVRYSGRLLGVTAFAPDPVRARRATARHAAEVYDRWTIAQTLHLIDLLRLCAGDLEEVLAGKGRRGADGEKNAALMMRFSSGALVTYLAYSSSGGTWELRLHGESVEAQLVPLERGTIRIGPRHISPLPDADRSAGKLKAGIPGQAAAFAEAVRLERAGLFPLSCFADHGRSLALAEQIQEVLQS